MNSNLINVTKKIILEGHSDKSEKDAVQNAFRKLQNEAFKSTPEPIIYMRPVNVSVLKNDVKSEEERFLVVLFPRTKTSFQVELEIEVEMSLLVL